MSMLQQVFDSEMEKKKMKVFNWARDITIFRATKFCDSVRTCECI